MPIANTSSRDTHRLKGKEWKRVFHTSGNRKETRHSHTYIRLNSLQAKNRNDRQRAKKKKINVNGLIIGAP